MMPRIAAEIPFDLSRHIERIIRDGWFPSEDALVREALQQFIEGKTFLGDSPRMLHRFAADALNESKPETALKFVDRATTLVNSQEMIDLTLYQALVELRVQILLIMGRPEEARISLEEAQLRLPNNPGISGWLSRLRRSETSQ